MGTRGEQNSSNKNNGPFTRKGNIGLNISIEFTENGANVDVSTFVSPWY